MCESHGHRVAVDVREREPDVRRADFLQQGRGLVIEAHERLLARAVVDGDRGPAEMLADAGGEGLGHGFLGGPARGVVLVRIFQGTAVGLLLLGEHALDETIPVFLERAADALGLDEVAAKADQDATGREGDAHGRKGLRTRDQGPKTSGARREKGRFVVPGLWSLVVGLFMGSSVPSSCARPRRCRCKGRG